MNETALQRLRLERDLRSAIDREELRLFYQPVFDVESRTLLAAEALLRWQHPSLGLVTPAEFIGVAEETGLIVSVGLWAMRSACAQLSEWRREGRPALDVSVNLSARQFREADLTAMARLALEDASLSPHHLCLELTESTLMRGDDATMRTLIDLKRAGVRIAIDDFGTGYSSLSYLKHFPIDVIKIDQSFVRDLESNPDDLAITRAVIEMAHSLRLTVVAEGVETEGQLALLREHGCDAAQGYLFGAPMPADEFSKWLDQERGA
jgi:EAL domain-containing protein (putative c-di-GMP-specific phosphodiesterase class I)